jgi:hypothetical protein
MCFNFSWKKRTSGLSGWKLHGLVIWPPFEPMMPFGIPKADVFSRLNASAVTAREGLLGHFIPRRGWLRCCQVLASGWEVLGTLSVTYTNQMKHNRQIARLR